MKFRGSAQFGRTDMNSRPFIRFKSLCKKFGEGPLVLHQLDLDIHQGEFVSFLGPSGCGKSTILRLIAGLLNPSSGSIEFMSITSPSSGTNPAPERAFIFQSPTLLPWLSVRDNIATPARLRGMAKAQRVQRAENLARWVQLEEVLDFYPRQLSGGMQMRVSIARALSLSPELLLLDEPFGALDAITRNRLNEELVAVQQKEQWTACFVTHSVQEAVFLSHRVVVLSSQPGRIASLIDVPMPFPRTVETRETEAYLRTVVQVQKALQGVLQQP